MNPPVLCVLRSGGVYSAQHVRALYKGVKAHWQGDLDFRCLTDTVLDIPGVRMEPLHYEWPGWWAKMELFRPDLRDDRLLYFDLDTVIIGDLMEIAAVKSLTLLRDFYRRSGLGSGLMMLPRKERDTTWDEWQRNPEGHMRRAGRGGDQRFLETLWLTSANRWQLLLPGQIVSYKVDVRSTGGLGKDARVICFHGNPRPWQVPTQTLRK